MTVQLAAKPWQQGLTLKRPVLVLLLLVALKLRKNLLLANRTLRAQLQLAIPLMQRVVKQLLLVLAVRKKNRLLPLALMPALAVKLLWLLVRVQWLLKKIVSLLVLVPMLLVITVCRLVRIVLPLQQQLVRLHWVILLRLLVPLSMRLKFRLMQHLPWLTIRFMHWHQLLMRIKTILQLQ